MVRGQDNQIPGTQLVSVSSAPAILADNNVVPQDQDQPDLGSSLQQRSGSPPIGDDQDDLYLPD